MSQQEQEGRPPTEDQPETKPEDRESKKVDTHQLFLKVKADRRRRKTFSGYEEYNLKHIRVQIEQDQILLLEQIKALAESLISKKRDLLLNDDGVVI